MTSPDMITCYSRSRHSNALDSNGVVGGLFARHYRSDGRSLLSFTILGVSSYLRSLGVPCSLYIDDRLNGELITSYGPWSTPFSERSDDFRLSAATSALYIVVSLLMKLGYTIGLKKSVLVPTTQLEHLGFIVDSEKQAFRIPARKIQSFAQLREYILARKNVDVKTLQRFQGKCISFSLAVPAAKLYIRNISASIASCTDPCQVKMTTYLFEEVALWRFLDTWSDVVPWREEKHVRLSISTDASNFGWGCVVHHPSGDRRMGDYWNSEELRLGIASKEMLAICRAVKSSPSFVRVDAQVDNGVAIDTFNGQGSRKSPQLKEVTKELYRCLLERNLRLELFYVPSEQNQADAPSRRLSASDSKLSSRAWQKVQTAFGGISGHPFDLMALDSNAQLDHERTPLPHFTPWPTPYSQGTNLFAQDLSDDSRHDLSNPYVFPPFAICHFAPVLKVVSQSRRPFTILVPGGSPKEFWWSVLMAMSSSVICLAREGYLDVLLFPSKEGFVQRACSYPLYACRVSRF